MNSEDSDEIENGQADLSRRWTHSISISFRCVCQSKKNVQKSPKLN